MTGTSFSSRAAKSRAAKQASSRRQALRADTRSRSSSSPSTQKTAQFGTFLDPRHLRRHPFRGDFFRNGRDTQTEGYETSQRTGIALLPKALAAAD
jgi:hypothetical protein